MKIRNYVKLIIVILTFSLSLNCYAVFDKDVLEKDYNSYLNIYLASKGYHFNNADFLKYDQKTFERYSYIPRLNTDDATSFIYYTIGLSFRKAFKKGSIKIEMYRNGFWGNDNLEGKDNGRNTFLFRYAFFEYWLTDDFNVVMGRQRFTIGNSLKDYFFYDIIDGIIFNFRPIKKLTFTILGDVLGIAGKPDTYLYSTIGTDNEGVKNFQGNVISFRIGLILDYKFDTFFGLKVFAFYLKFGVGFTGGADIAENGNNDTNQADNDFLINSGTRIYFGQIKTDENKEKTRLSFDLTFNYSFGKDYQLNKTKTYNDFGAAFNTQLDFGTDFIIFLSGGFFGKNYAGLKGMSMGGLLLYTYKGYFVSPYAESYHFKDYAKYETPTTVDKTFPKYFALLELRFMAENWTFSLYTMGLWETGSKEYMGTDIQLRIEKKIEYLTFRLEGAVYFPSKYYEKRKDIFTYLPAGKDPFYGIAFSITFQFGVFKSNTVSEENDIPATDYSRDYEYLN